MRAGAYIFSFIIFNLLLTMFGLTAENTLIAIVLGNGTWKDIFSWDSLMSFSNLLLSATAVVGIVQKNTLLIFAGVSLFLMDLVFGISGIINYFPAPFGQIIFGLFSFVYVWLIFEWWRSRDD